MAPSSAGGVPLQAGPKKNVMALDVDTSWYRDMNIIEQLGLEFKFWFYIYIYIETFKGFKE